MGPGGLGLPGKTAIGARAWGPAPLSGRPGTGAEEAADDLGTTSSESLPHPPTSTS